MQSEIQTLQRDPMFLPDRVVVAMEKKQVCPLRIMLETLLYFITLNPNLLCLNQIQSVISKVSRLLQEALSLACECRRETIFCQIFTGTRTKTMADVHKLYHLSDTCITNMNWLLLFYFSDFNSVFDEIFLSLPQILTNDSSVRPYISMLTEDAIWELTRTPLSDNLGIILDIRIINGIERLLPCLAKLVEADDGELQYNCLKTIEEITAGAESNLDLPCKLFKKNSRGSKAIIQQVIKETEDPTLQVLAIRSIDSLAKTFKREDYNIINILVLKLGNKQQEVVIEAVGALIKFVCEDNYLCKEDSKNMIELNAAIKPLVKLLIDVREDDYQQRQKLLLHGLVLICHLAVNVDYNMAMEEAKVLTVMQHLLTTKRGLRKVVSQHVK